MIQVEQVGVVSGGVALLDPVSLDVSRGEALVVRGSNGAGKSTLLRVLAGARTPTSGSARIADTVVTEGDRMLRRRVSTMIGLPPMAVDLTVRDHVLLVATTWVDDGDAAAELADGVLAELGIDWLGERYPHELSSGQTQLFGLALVLARPFDVLILDEPEQRLDPEHVDAVIEVLRARRDAGATLVIATHSSVLADALADQTVVLKRVA
ncbi:ATP-binding cassette domain-containing protein [Microbacterium keratanolyticum]|uniref:ABC transporter ATP-binding protein n=1 Tax=Microbacterium keratanolyticum TaxID=67574 RepID=UPI003642FAFC